MPIPLVADRAYVRAIRSQMLYPLSYGRAVREWFHARFNHLDRHYGVLLDGQSI